MNPYASFLGGQDPLAVIAATPARLSAIVNARTPAQLDEPLAPGKWSVRQVLIHLADTEMVFAFRIRQTLAEPGHTIQPFDQDLWAKHYDAYDALAAIRLFVAAREWNVALLRTLPADAFALTVTHPERGAMTLQTIVETMGGHDVNHLRVLEQ